jgi:HlyD family secretion protein
MAADAGNDSELGEQRRLLRGLRLDPADRDAPSGAGATRTLWIALAALAVLVLAGAVAYWQWRGRPLRVETALALAPSSTQGPSAILQASGYVTARREATVSAQITGKLKEVLIEEGEHVRKGQVLARLDDAALQAALSQARAQLLGARALEAQYQAQLAQVQRDNQRNQDLFDRGLASRQALEATQTQQVSLAAQLEVQRKQIELADAELRGAQVQLEYCTVRAPFDGVIVAKAAQAGEIISPISAGGGFTRTGVGTIVDMDSLEIEVDVNEAYLHRVQPRQGAQAVLDAYPDWNIPAHVIAIIPTADRNKATVKVRVALEQKDPRILPDMGVRVSFLEQTGTAAAGPGAAGPPAVAGVLVPATAVVAGGGGAGGSIVYLVEGGKVRSQPVTPGQVYGELRAVTGVAAGAQLVRSPPPGLHDGARVAVAAAGSSP